MACGATEENIYEESMECSNVQIPLLRLYDIRKLGLLFSKAKRQFYRANLPQRHLLIDVTETAIVMLCQIACGILSVERCNVLLYESAGIAMAWTIVNIRGIKQARRVLTRP